MMIKTTERINLFDDGYLKLIETWGSDEGIVETARMSTNKGFNSWWPYWECRRCLQFVVKDDAGSAANPGGCTAELDTAGIAVGMHAWRDVPQGDLGLLRYLYDHKHSSPFEFAGMTIEVQAPIMVFREWHRHRTQAYSEMSARYTPLPNSNYMPTPERCLVVNAKNRQAGAIKGSEELTHESALEWLDSLSSVYDHAERVYQDGLRRGIPKEVARLPVPVGRYTRMRATANLRNWMLFMTLRRDETAQHEIRQYALNAGDHFIAEAFPKTWDLFTGKRD